MDNSSAKRSMRKALAKPKADKPRAKPGPKPAFLKVHGDWQAAIRKSLKKRKPPGGWPK
jgi:hypothetical protein